MGAREYKMRLYTERLILRLFTDADAADLFDYLKEPEVNCFACMKLADLEAAKQAVSKRISDEYYFAIELKETGKVIGEIFAQPESTDPEQDDNDTISPCWMLNPAYQGKGYMYEAVKAYYDYLFEKCGIRRIYTYTEDYNIACQRLCEKLGMRKEGEFKEFVSFVKNENGEPIYENTLQYAILKKEWQKNK